MQIDNLYPLDEYAGCDNNAPTSPVEAPVRPVEPPPAPALTTWPMSDLRPLVRSVVVESKTGKALPVLTCRLCGETKTFARVMVNKVTRFPGYVEYFRLHNSPEHRKAAECGEAK